MNEEELIKDIKETKYNEENVEKLLYELENDTGNYSCYDNAIAIIYYKNLYQKEKEIWKETENDYEHELARKDEKIEKQQKEIEDLKEDLSKKVKALDIAMSNPDYICKDKIKAKIKELEEQCEKELLTTWLESQIDVLKELLGE